MRVCPSPLLLYRPHLLSRENWWVLVDAPSSSRRCRDTWAPGLWWGNKSLEVGGGKRRGGGRGTDFSFKAKGELCQLTASACAGPLTRQWEQTAAG